MVAFDEQSHVWAPDILPWHEADWRRFSELLSSGRLPQAFLLQGVEGLGKRSFGNAIAMAILCENRHEDCPGCGTCRQCLWVKAKSHPDFTTVLTEEGKQSIGVLQVRMMIDRVMKTRSGKNTHVILVYPADKLSTAACNCLLKTLEEPPANTLFIFITDKPSILPATLRSRCQAWTFQIPEINIVKKWLQTVIPESQEIDQWIALAEGVPISCYQLANSDLATERKVLLEKLELITKQKCCPIETAKSLDMDFSNFFWILSTWIMDMIRFHMTSGECTIVNLDSKDTIKKISNHINIKKLFKSMDRVFQLKEQISKGFSLNKQLILEECLISLMRSVER